MSQSVQNFYELCITTYSGSHSGQKRAKTRSENSRSNHRDEGKVGNGSGSAIIDGTSYCSEGIYSSNVDGIGANSSADEKGC